MKINSPVIGIFGHYGNHNLGDESIIESSISQVRSRLPTAKICCFSLRPKDSARRHEVEAYGIRYTVDDYGPIKPEQAPTAESMPWNIHAKMVAQGSNPDDYSSDVNATGIKARIKQLPLIGDCIKALIFIIHRSKTLKNEAEFLLRSYRYLQQFDLIVIAGSNQFLDHMGGSWDFPYTLLKWTFLAKLTGTKIAFASVGANPFEQPLSKKMIHAALRKADYISYRDCASKELIESDQPGFEGEVFPDLAFGLNFTPISKTTRRNKPLIGINPMPVYDYRYWNVRDDGQYHAYVAKLARLAERLISENYPVVFFPTMWRDDYVIIDILKEMDPKIRSKVEDSKLVNHCDEVSELTNLLQDIDIVVATRFHGTLLPLLVNTPVLGISYYRKNADLMNEFGQDDYHETLEECDVDRLYSKLMTLASNLQQTKADIFQKTKEYQDLTAKQWDRIIQLIT